LDWDEGNHPHDATLFCCFGIRNGLAFALPVFRLMFVFLILGFPFYTSRLFWFIITFSYFWPVIWAHLILESGFLCLAWFLHLLPRIFLSVVGERTLGVCLPSLVRFIQLPCRSAIVVPLIP
jgi:hypothetical protein